MPSIVDEHGIAREPVGATVFTDENLDRFVDILIAKLNAAGVSIRDIGKILNRSKSTVQRRMDDMTPEARDFYVSLQLA